MHCTACRSSFDRCHGSSAKSQSILAVARLECLLRAALTGNRIANLGDRLLASQSLLLFLEDATWALMQPVAGTQYRALHTLQTMEFRVPMGFNTPVNADNWLSRGPLAVPRTSGCPPFHPRRARESDLAHRGQRHPVSHCGRGRTFWKAMKPLRCSEDRQALKDRAARWDPT
jgi:hypothetical protein